MPALADYLKYANLQMAAEALFGFDATPRGTILTPEAKAGDEKNTTVNLTTGNLHASKFPNATAAQQFVDQWTVVEHLSNTTTGFSGTLFKAIKDDPAQGIVKGQYVLSFRSTEFLDDAARDNTATNVLEIKEKGWAFGQISDMEDWYQSLKSRIDGPLAVTGYSLGGHLATAFNLLHPGAASQVVTFNGAGVGKIGDGRLATTQQQLPEMIRTFQELRQEGEASGLLRLMQSDDGRAAYLALKAELAQTNGVPVDKDSGVFNARLENLIQGVRPTIPDEPGAAARLDDYGLLYDAVSRIKQVFNYAHWAPTLYSGADDGPANPANVQDLYLAADNTQKLAIAAESLDYQLAVLSTATRYRTEALGIIAGAEAALGKPTPAAGSPLTNQWDLAGTETTTDPWYMVAYSQYRYGNPFNLFIEDQPFARGNAVSATFKKLMAGKIQLLHDQYAKNDFGDTHSLVLIVDSLAVQNTLLNLIPAAEREAAAGTLDTLLREASWRKAEVNNDQGKAEGDVLENVVNALADLFLGPQKKADRLNGSPEGNTWATINDFTVGSESYTGRERLYQRLQAIVGSAAYDRLARSGTLELAAVSASLAERARDDFGAFAALYSLSPFVFTGPDQTIAEAVGSGWQEIYQDWEADRTAHENEDPDHEDGITDHWFADRAEFLRQKIDFNASNRNPYAPDAVDIDGSPTRAEVYFEDVATGYKIQQGRLEGSSARRYYFGAEEDDTFTGGDHEDHLYGGAGNDTLDGGSGDDHLEGNSGADELKGSEGQDTLLGGRGDDTLDGGAGNDFLEGGKDEDTYAFTGDYGTDVVNDSDGKGSILIDGQTLGGFTYLSENIYKDNDSGRIAVRINGGASLVIMKEDDANRILVKNWSETRSLGISLQGDPQVAPAVTLAGDFKRATEVNYNDGTYVIGGHNLDEIYLIDGHDFVSVGAGSYVIDGHNYVSDGEEIYVIGPHNYVSVGAGIYVFNGYSFVSVGEEIYVIDFLTGTSGNDVIDGREGDDVLSGKSGDDYLLGGSGSDAIQGGLGKDTIVGGLGNDVIYGSSDVDINLSINRPGFPKLFNIYPHPQCTGFEWISGYAGRVSTNILDNAGPRLSDDQGNLIDGGAGDDFIAAGSGADTVHGGADKDWIWGMDEADILFGDGDNDYIFGDANQLSSGSLIWALPENYGNDVIDGGEGDDTLFGQGKDDIIFGGEGNDILLGDDFKDYLPLPADSHGKDLLFGGEGDDWLFGEAREDYLEGGAGVDTLVGGAGVDTLIGGRGTDFLDGNEGSDLYLLLDEDRIDTIADTGRDDLDHYSVISHTYVAANDYALLAQFYRDGPAIWSTGYRPADGLIQADTLDVGPGTTLDNVTITGSELSGYLVILRDDGSGARVKLARPDDPIGTGIEWFRFGDGHQLTVGDMIARMNANHVINGTAADDVFSFSGSGSDTFSGGGGNDVFMFGVGSGQDVIIGASGVGETDTLRFGDGIVPSNVKAEWTGDDLRFSIVGATDAVLLRNARVSPVIERLAFANGTEVPLNPGTVDEVFYGAWPFTPDWQSVPQYRGRSTWKSADRITVGWGGDASVSGLDGNDTLTGGIGNDWISGGSEDDILTGGAGRDWLFGEAGNDVYVFNRGDGMDVVSQQNAAVGDVDVLRFGTGINPADIAESRDVFGTGVMLRIADSGDAVRLESWFDPNRVRIARVEFSDGTVWNAAHFDALANNHIPEVGVVLDTQSAKAGTAFHFALPEVAFVDQDLATGDALTLAATRNDGTLLPTWLRFDALTGSFDGTPGNDDIGTVTLRVTATDLTGASVSSDFDLVVANANHAPVVANVIGTQSAIEGRVFRLTVPLDAFTDVDVGDELTLSATLVDGSDLPAWLTFDAATRSFSGTPAFADTGNIDIRLTASDIAGASASQTIRLAVDAVTGLTLIATAGNDTLTGTRRNDTLDGGNGLDRLIGGAGDDTYVIDNNGDVVVELAGEGIDTVVSSVSSMLAANVENLTLAGNVNLAAIGNVLDNVLTGNAGSNSLNGGQGADTLVGGAGNDAYVVDNLGDVIVENAGEGADLVQSSVTHTLAANVENLILTGTSAIGGTGNALNNLLAGNGGNNVLDGGAGNDTLSGGAGDDTYVVDSTGDTINEAAGAGTDLVLSSVTHTLAVNVENLTLTGNSAINGTGNTLDNVLTGNDAANILDGSTGDDTLKGGLGDDTYVVDAMGDVVTEIVGEGGDLVKSSITWTLGANLEKLTLTGGAAINGTGNALANTLAGNTAGNVLDGGAGADTLSGGAGDDLYIVDDLGDDVREGSGAGTDLVLASVTCTLSANVEKLTLTGTSVIDGTGNTLANVLVGNGANNTLSGGAGADTMQGGDGDDTYVVDDAGDVVSEAAGGGGDLVQSCISYALTANVEQLTLTGTSAINGTGNELDNILMGNSGTNSLTGGAGNDTLNGDSGADTMIGGLGDDSYTVDNVADIVGENAGEGTDTVTSSVTLTLAGDVEALLLGGSSAINGTGNDLDNLVRGNPGNNMLDGGIGNDVLEGGTGNDTLSDTSGSALFNGGDWSDRITGGAGAELFIGGTGHDTITAAGGNDLICFNKGDGQDTFAAGGTGSDTLSLGGAFAYSELAFSKSSNDLVLKMGASDQITLKDWYSATPSKPVVNLQVIAEALSGFSQGGADQLLDQKVERFNFATLANAFDAARLATPALTTWALSNALATALLDGSDTAALGGDLAYHYGRNGTLSGIGLAAAQAVINDANFGRQAQTFNPLANLQTGAVRLS